jgi:predicted Fe-S protein YdhL (DUF1289 family)
MSDALAEVIPKSPCTKVCTLGPDNVCLGCFRHLTEVATWIAMTPHEQRHVLAVAAARRRAAATTAGN